jgi:nucleoside-diphosphate-sugar epimerase
MRVLVTGATGFIGQRVVRRLAQDNHEIYGLVRESARALPHCTPVVWDIGVARRPANLPARLDAVVHAAQSRNYRNFPADALEITSVNVAGTVALLDYAAGIGVGRFCLISSGTVYEPYGGELKEDAALDPPGILGASKLAAETVARPYGALFPLAILRLFFPYGPGQQDRLVPDLIGRLRGGRPIQIAPDGEGLRLVPTFVDDIAEVIVSALTESWRGTLNVSAPTAVSIRRLAETIAGMLGARPHFEMVEQHSPNVVPHLDRLGARFDLGRFTSLEYGLRQTIAALPPERIAGARQA